MNGLELTRRYAIEVVLPALERAAGSLMPSLAVGSVGDGSDRFGFDDEVSRDHDWGVALCIWMPDGEPETVREVRTVLEGLPKTYRGWPVLGTGASCPAGRAGVFTVGEHYYRFCGMPGGPRSADEWDAVPEYALAAATNGAVFWDGPGAFSAVRERLLAGYPEPVRLKRIAERCLAFAQAGQANLVRAVLRGDRVGSRVAYARMHEAACLLAHALSRRFCPYYKWQQASCAEWCGTLGEEVALVLEYLAAPEGPVELMDAVGTQRVVDAIAAALLEELSAQGLACGQSLFLLDHVDYIRSLVKDRELLARPSPQN